jgi:hypothetical protein
VTVTAVGPGNASAAAAPSASTAAMS